MKFFVLACLLPVVAGPVAWLVLRDAPTPEVVDAPARKVTTLVAADSSGNGHRGIIQGPVELGLPGHDGGTSYSFASRDSWVQVPSSPELNPEDHDFLVSAWVNLESSPGEDENYDVVRKGVGYTFPGEFKLEVLGRGRVRCSAKDGRGHLATVISEKPSVTDGAWHRIGCARAGAMWGVLVDDTFTANPVDLGSVTNTVALSIGSKYGLEDRPDGRVDDVRLVVGPPPEESLDDFAAAVRAMESQPPTGWWRLDEAATRVARR